MRAGSMLVARAWLRAACAVIVVATGCTSNSYRIAGPELQRLASVAPERRGDNVHVVQELGASRVPSAERVDDDTRVVLRGQVDLDGNVGGGGRVHTGGGGGGHVKTGGGFHFSGAGGGKGAAIALLVIAATILVIVAAAEAERFDGYARLHPMHPLHLVGRDGAYLGALPLAWLDPETAATVDHAVVKPYEGPLRRLRNAPLQRLGWTYGVYAGVGSYASADGTTALGTATSLQLGYFPHPKIGVAANVFFGWRDNTYAGTLLETRYTAELQVMPVRLDALHVGFYAGAGAAYRFEDGPIGGNAGGTAFTGGAMLQLELHPRIALTARAGLARAHDQQMPELLLGLSVY